MKFVSSLASSLLLRPSSFASCVTTCPSSGLGGGGAEDEVTVDEGADFLAERVGLGGFTIT